MWQSWQDTYARELAELTWVGLQKQTPADGQPPEVEMDQRATFVREIVISILNGNEGSAP